jgi:hypothetical protein
LLFVPVVYSEFVADDFCALCAPTREGGVAPASLRASLREIHTGYSFTKFLARTHKAELQSTHSNTTAQYNIQQQAVTRYHG